MLRNATKRLIAIACVTALLVAASVAVALRERQQPMPPDVPVAQTPTKVCVKAVERKGCKRARTYDEATGLLVAKTYADGKDPAYTYTPNGSLATRT